LEPERAQERARLKRIALGTAVSKKRGIFERETLWNLWFLALVFGMGLLVTLKARRAS